ncbi:GlxA family transcriptional regulator [Methylocella silvestris]|uniref:AraC family transcriptional regulator n=1 Tax=Methylocella silvestris TaxID=199596 RepID=A0A2J7TJL7_METSI|nr:helix-turn-helix domain-containing protein [Methylocella silvestris]PNG26956.1 AraC family transcriptional regulator [Methylocella silvestris]
MIIYLLALDGVFDTGLAALLDAFGAANDLSGAADIATAPFTVRIIGVRKHVKTAQGLIVPVRPFRDSPPPDLVIVPALGTKTPETLLAAMERKDVAEARRLLRAFAGQGAEIAAACTATFLLAGAGLLDGLPATTSWWLAPLFRARYPQVDLDESRMIVETRRRITAGAALGHLDLALRVIRRVSPALAAITGKYLLADPRPSQAAFIVPDHLAHNDPIVERFERWARSHLADGFSLPAAALAIGSSERTLARRLRSVLGRSPLSFFQDLRVERATHLLQTTSDSVEQIAAQVGYADGVTLRTLLRRRTGRSARDLRLRDASHEPESRPRAAGNPVSTNI